MIPVYDSEGRLDHHSVKKMTQFWRNGYIVTKYAVLVPDRTISGDYRHELVEVEQEATVL